MMTNVDRKKEWPHFPDRFIDHSSIKPARSPRVRSSVAAGYNLQVTRHGWKVQSLRKKIAVSFLDENL